MTTNPREIFEKIQADAIARGDLHTRDIDTSRAEPVPYPGLQPPEQVKLGKKNRESFSRIEDLIESDIQVLDTDIPDVFKGLGYISRNQKEKRDFSDTELKDEPAIVLCALNDEDTCILGKFIFAELTSGVSRSSVAGILLLAFQLRKQGFQDMGRVFPENVPSIFNIANDYDYTKLNKTKMIYVGPSTNIPESSDISSNAQAYAFLAASMLRMFTRSPENYVKAWSHIVKGYTTFYNKTMPLGDFNPNQEILKVIHRQFSVDTLLKSTLFRILYMSNDSDDNNDNDRLKKFLFDRHLSHTGMHILPIIIELCDTLHCQASLLLVFLWKGEYDRQIECISTLLSWILASPPDKTRAMWRYGRIFTQNFMPMLQTKSCPKLVYILAAALQQEKPQEHARILDIAQLQEVSASDKVKCVAGGKYLVKLIRKNVNREHGGVLQTCRIKTEV